MIEVTFNCDTCEKSVRRKYKTMSALVQTGQPKTFRLYKGVMSCVKCRRKIMGPKKFAQNKKVSDARAEKKRIREEEWRLEAEERRQRRRDSERGHIRRMRRHFEERFGPIEDLK